MLKKTITYKDLDGNDVTEDFYFNLSKAEVIDMELGHGGQGLSDYLQNVIKSNNNREILDNFKLIITSALGKRSESGKSFIKDPEYVREFLGSEAWSELFTELVTDGTAAADFIKGILPSDIGKLTAQSEPAVQELAANNDKPPTPKDVREMSREELIAAFQEKNKS